MAALLRSRVPDTLLGPAASASCRLQAGWRRLWQGTGRGAGTSELVANLHALARMLDADIRGDTAILCRVPL